MVSCKSTAECMQRDAFPASALELMFGFHNFYDLNSGPILALYHKLSFNTYFKHDIARCRIPCHHIYLKQLHFQR